MIKEKMYLAISAIAIAVIAIARLVTTLKYSAKEKENLEKLIHIPVLGEIPLDESCYNEVIRCEDEFIEVEEILNV